MATKDDVAGRYRNNKALKSKGLRLFNARDRAGCAGNNKALKSKGLRREREECITAFVL